MSAPSQGLLIWCLLRDQFAHVKPVEEAFGTEARFVYDGDWKPEKLVAGRPDVVVCVNDFHYEVALCLEAAKECGIPSLTLQDGILEWRCQYENPLFGARGALQHEPVLADKIACIGAQSARQIAAWGNPKKVEVTGLPRLDYLHTTEASPVRQPGNRILVMTAKNPGFTPEQRELTLRSLKDLKASLDARPDLEVFWRISPKVVSELGVENRYQNAISQELTVLLKQVDCVISTPSTAILEAMALNRPVAALDYHNVPRFVPTAWTISAPDHIGSVVRQLCEPSANKMAFQGQCLNDCLRWDGPSTPRVVNLIREMARLATQAKQESKRLELPASILAPEFRVDCAAAVNIKGICPSDGGFESGNLTSLQLKLSRLENENARLRQQVAARNIPAYLVSKFYRWWKKAPRKNL